MEKIEELVDILIRQIGHHLQINRGVIVVFSLLFFISYALSKLPYLNLLFSPQIVLMVGMLLFFLLFPKKALYVLFIGFLCLFAFYTITGGVINDIFQNAFFILILVTIVRPIFYHGDE